MPLPLLGTVLPSQQLCKVDVTIPILQMRKQSLRGKRAVPLGPSTKWQDQDSSPDSLQVCVQSPGSSVLVLFRQEYWSGLSFPSPGDLPDPGITHPRFLRLLNWQADSLPLIPPREPDSLQVKVKSLSRVRLFATLWTVAYHAPPSMGFFRREYWSGLPFPSPDSLQSQS